MRNLKWVGLAAAVLLLAACLAPWVYIESRQWMLTGIDTKGTNFGKPAYLHLVLLPFFVAFTLIPRIWAKRFNLLVAAINLAWAARNYLETTGCSGGECPEKQWGIFLLLAASVLMLLSTFFPDMPSTKQTEAGREK